MLTSRPYKSCHYAHRLSHRRCSSLFHTTFSGTRRQRPKMAHRQRNPLLRDRDIFIVAIGQLVGMLNPIGIMGLLRGANNAATTTDMQATNAAIADAALVAAASNNSTTAAFSSASATVGLDMYIVLGSGEDIQGTPDHPTLVSPEPLTDLTLCQKNASLPSPLQAQTARRPSFLLIPPWNCAL